MVFTHSGSSGGPGYDLSSSGWTAQNLSASVMGYDAGQKFLFFNTNLGLIHLGGVDGVIQTSVSTPASTSSYYNVFSHSNYDTDGNEVSQTYYTISKSQLIDFVYFHSYDVIFNNNYGSGGTGVSMLTALTSAPRDLLTTTAVQNLGGSPNADVLVLNNVQGSEAYGQGGNDRIIGGTLDNRVYGQGGSDTLDGGEGSDTLDGGEGDDIVHGGAGDDYITVSADGDSIFGDDGADTFALPLDVESLLSVTTVNGGTAATGEDRDEDTIRLPGAMNDYDIHTTFTGGKSWGETVAIVTTLGGHELRLTEVERIVFETNAIDNVVHLTAGSIAVEALRLADEVYANHIPVHLTGGRLRQNLDSDGHARTRDYLAYEVNSLSATSDDALARNWRAVSALELGMKPADYGSGELKYSFVEGFYAAFKAGDRGPAGSRLSDDAEANALLLVGEVDGVETLAISFRGTDQWADWDTYLDFADHYALFRPLVEKLNQYISDYDIKQVIVSGHSLGAAMVQQFMAKNANAGGVTYRAFTDGSPGGDEGAADDSRIVNFIHTDDLVALAPTVTDPVLKALLGTVVTAAAFNHDIFLGIEVGKLFLKLKTKVRDGSEVYLDSGITDASIIGSTTEHSSRLYTRDVAKLVEFAREDGDSPFRHSELASALRAGTPYHGDKITIGVGKPLRSDLRDASEPDPDTVYSGTISNPLSEDNYVLGSNNGADKVLLSTTIVSAVGFERIFDGGASGGDIVIFQGPGVARGAGTTSDGGVMVEYKGVGHNAEWRPVGTFYRFEQINGPDGEPIKGPDGNPIFDDDSVAERPNFGAPTFQIVGWGAYADAGNGDMRVDGTANEDLVFYGDGKKSIYGHDGDDFVVSKPNSSEIVRLFGQGGDDTLIGGSGGDQVDGGNGNDTIDGKAGADTLIGGKGNDTYRLDNKGDRVVEKAAQGEDTVIATASATLAANVETLVLEGDASKGTGNGLANLLLGNGKANALAALGGNDTVLGGAGGDALTGGAGDDLLSGDAGNDLITGSTGKDQLIGGGGNDRFVFNAKLKEANADTIVDFKHDRDLIQLEDAIFKTTGSKLDNGEFYAKAGATKAHDKDDRIIYDKSTGKLYSDDDGKGGHAAVHFATLTNAPHALDARDFGIV